MNQKVSVPAFGLFFLGWWLSSSPLGLFWFTRRRGPPIQNPCCPWVIVFECLGSERAPSPFDESVWQGGARRNAPKGGEKKMSSFGCVGVIYSPFVVGCCIERFSRLASLSLLAGRWSAKTAIRMALFFLLLLSSLGCILTICYLFKWISVRLSGLSGWFFLLLRCRDDRSIRWWIALTSPVFSPDASEPYNENLGVSARPLNDEYLWQSPLLASGWKTGVGSTPIIRWRCHGEKNNKNRKEILLYFFFWVKSRSTLNVLSIHHSCYYYYYH